MAPHPQGKVDSRCYRPPSMQTARQSIPHRLQRSFLGGRAHQVRSQRRLPGNSKRLLDTLYSLMRLVFFFLISYLLYGIRYVVCCTYMLMVIHNVCYFMRFEIPNYSSSTLSYGFLRSLTEKVPTKTLFTDSGCKRYSRTAPMPTFHYSKTGCIPQLVAELLQHDAWTHRL